MKEEGRTGRWFCSMTNRVCAEEVALRAVS